MKKIFLLFLFINLLFFTNNFANAVEEPIEVECPLGGSNAKGWEILGSAFYGVLLDGRQYGAHVGPLPPPECPDNGFLVYKESFSENELIQLRKYIFSQEYQSMWKNKAPAFYRLAKIYEYMGAPIIDHYYHYVIATWRYDHRYISSMYFSNLIQEEIEALKKTIDTTQSDLLSESQLTELHYLLEASYEKKYSFYALEAIEALKKTIDTTQSDLLSESQLTELHYLLAELYRRVGDFENARKELHWVMQTNDKEELIDPLFIEYLDSLILQKDSDPHLISDYSTLPELTKKEEKMVSVIKKGA